MKSLVIAEKNKAAQAMAEALGKYNVSTINGSIKLYKVNFGNKEMYIIPLRGHLMDYQNSQEYKSWTAKDPRNIITDPGAIQREIKKDMFGYISTLKQYGQLADEIIIATDADIEGCGIGLIDALPFARNRQNKTILQLWLHDLQPQSIRNAFSKLIKPKWSWAYSADTRALIDAVIGFSGTREITISLKDLFDLKKKEFLSIGRVQTALLYQIFLREKKIREFESKKSWSITAQIPIFNQKIKAEHIENDFEDEKEAHLHFDPIQKIKEGSIINFKDSIKKIQPPTPLNTSKALTLITAQLKISAKRALKILEDLYLNKIISYPRTDSDKYSQNYDHKKNIIKLSKSPKYSKYCENILQSNRKPKQGKVDAGDHSPITPLIYLPRNSSKFESDQHYRTYELILQSYLAIFGEEAIEYRGGIVFDIHGEKFSSHIEALSYPGFYQIAPFLQKKYSYTEKFIKKLAKTWKEYNKLQKDKIPINVDKIELKEKNSKPPLPYTESQILQKMNKLHLGTKSTRPEIIQKLIDRNYIHRIKTRLIIQPMGYTLMEILEPTWKEFLEPDFTKKVEEYLEKIQKEKIQPIQAISEMKQDFLRLFDQFRNQKNKIRQILPQLFQNNKTHQEQKQKNTRNKVKNKEIITTANCPKCKKYPMKFFISPQKKTRMLKCTNPSCDHVLFFPKLTTISILKNKCKICNFNIAKITKREKGKKKIQYYICPNCFNNRNNNQNITGLCFQCQGYEVISGRCYLKGTKNKTIKKTK